MRPQEQLPEATATSFLTTTFFYFSSLHAVPPPCSALLSCSTPRGNGTMMSPQLKRQSSPIPFPQFVSLYVCSYPRSILFCTPPSPSPPPLTFVLCTTTNTWNLSTPIQFAARAWGRWEVCFSVHKSIGLTHLWVKLHRQHHHCIHLYCMRSWEGRYSEWGPRGVSQPV